MDARNQTQGPLQEQCKLWVAEPSLQPYEILNEEGNKVKEINKVKNEFVKGKTLAGETASGENELILHPACRPELSPGTHKAEEGATPAADFCT